MLQSRRGMLVVRDLKNTVGECKVGVCKLGMCRQVGCASWGVQVGLCKLGSARSVVGYVGMLCGVEVQVGVCRLGCASWGVPSAFMMTSVSCFLLLLTACLLVRCLLSVMGCSSH